MENKKKGTELHPFSSFLVHVLCMKVTLSSDSGVISCCAGPGSVTFLLLRAGPSATDKQSAVLGIRFVPYELCKCFKSLELFIDMIYNSPSK